MNKIIWVISCAASLAFCSNICLATDSLYTKAARLSNGTCVDMGIDITPDGSSATVLTSSISNNSSIHSSLYHIGPFTYNSSTQSYTTTYDAHNWWWVPFDNTQTPVCVSLAGGGGFTATSDCECKKTNPEDPEPTGTCTYYATYEECVSTDCTGSCDIHELVFHLDGSGSFICATTLHYNGTTYTH